MDSRNPQVSLAESLVIGPAAERDLDAIMLLFADARLWQKERGFDVWKEFDPTRIASDILSGQVFVAKIGKSILGTVTLIEDDPLVWGPSEEGRALYVHRLASARKPRPQGVGTLMLRWAQEFAQELGKEYLRLDTWNNNPSMRNFYERNGFRHVADKFFPMDSPLPADYRGTYKSLFELKLE